MQGGGKEVHVDVRWDMPVSDVKTRANKELRKQIKALTPAEQIALASMNDSKVAVGIPKSRKEQRLVFQDAVRGDLGFTATDETMTLREVYRVRLMHHTTPIQEHAIIL